MGDTVEGTVKWFNEDKGYGFIGVPNQPDVFVHVSNVNHVDGLQPNDRVTFQLGEGRKGPEAMNVTVTS